MTTLRIAFFGTPEIAVPTLERLLAGPHTVPVVVSQPDRPRGRGRKTSPSPVSQVAERAGIPLLRPERVGDPDCIAALEAHAPDLGVVVAFGQFIPKRARELPRLGYLVNAHASLLPRHRGAAPIAHAILAGDRKTGVSVMRVERQMDAGPVALVRETPIGDDEEAGNLAERLGELAAEAIADATREVATGTVVWTEQEHARATLAPKISKSDAQLDFRREASFLARQVRALAPSPGAVTSLEGEPLRILAAAVEAGSASESPGTLQRDDDGNLRIATTAGWLVPKRIQRPGGKPLAVDAFLRGRPIEEGTVLGGAST
ncbi:MAG: methionyl-tRNA formyltransferase [Myxococcota bacterium]|nr:methionyl-tRNA formyltransferase [Myxococcota bacterium]